MIKITLPFPPSSNTAYATDFRTKRRFKSKKFNDWLKLCKPLPSYNIDYAVRITYNFYFPDKRIRDGQSYLKVVLDYMVKQGVFKDDNIFIVASEEWKIGGFDKDNHRVEIEIDKIDDK